MNIPKRSSRCEKGEEAFERGSSYVSHIIETSKGYVRRDYCQKCASLIKKEEGCFLWQGKIPEKNEKEPMDEKSFQLLEEIINKPEHLDILTLLVLSLQRKKQLIKIDQEHYESVYTGSVFRVPPYVLNPKDSEPTLTKLKALLNGSG